MENKVLINSVSFRCASIITVVLTLLVVVIIYLLNQTGSLEITSAYIIAFAILTFLIVFFILHFFVERRFVIKQNTDDEASNDISEEYLVNTEKLASLGKMTAGIVHEINSALTGIITFSHLILKRMPKERSEDVEDLKIIISQAERCSRFVSGLLSFSRQGISQKDSVDINKLIEDTLSMLKNQMKFQNINFVVRYDDNLPKILIDDNQIQQVLINILLNAADAMNERGTITIVTSQREIDDKRYIEISLQDTGCGIKQQYLDKVFDPFFTTKPKGQGTGLGLAVCNNIVKKNDGYILVKSEHEKGATFTIGLPTA